MSISDALDASNTGSRATAIYIAVLAVLLSISSVGGDNASKTVTMTSIEMADTYAFYQAKNIRQNDLKLAADALEAQSQMPGVSDAARNGMAAKIAEYRADIKRYESDPRKARAKRNCSPKPRCWKPSARSRCNAIRILTTARGCYRSPSCWRRRR